jgi:phosphomannomutase
VNEERRTLLQSLNYKPRDLKFGTSGRRGLLVDLSQLEVYIAALGDLEYLQSLPVTEGGIKKGEEFFFAYDLRPSSTAYSDNGKGRGELAQAIEQAINDAGMKPVNLGAIPTPALGYYALLEGKGSIMITGSHIPFDRNGYKTHGSRGELLKHEEAPIFEAVERVRERVYLQPVEESPFDESGRFKTGHRELRQVLEDGKAAYVRRYVEFAGNAALKGLKLLFYQHSAVGHELVPEILQALGAEVFLAGKSDTFVPIDTENIDREQLKVIQALVNEATKEHGHIDAIVSTDGDSDRPLMLGVDDGSSRVTFFGGDLVGMIVAEFLGADAVVVPINCNDAIDRGPLAKVLEPKTRIGSPYVIAGMEAAQKKGRKRVCGWEANGGFLTGSDFVREERVLKALPTRDAVLPIVGVLMSAKEQGVSLSELFSRLPRRFSRPALIRNFPREDGRRIVDRFTPPNNKVTQIEFNKDDTALLDAAGERLPEDARQVARVEEIWRELGRYFSRDEGFSEIVRLNYADGVRMTFANGDVAHLRPSGNADEFRFYAVADTQERADEISRRGIAESKGILRRMEKDTQS